MTFGTLFQDWMILCVFLLAGYVLRETIPVLQKIYLPSAVIGGAVALIGGQQVLGIWEVPASFSSYSGTLIALIMTSIVWGVKINRDRIKGYLDYLCFLNTVQFGQIAIAALTGIGLRLMWKNLPEGWGLMAFSAYFGGHGTVATYAGAFESLGMGQDYVSIGMIEATMGLVCAVTVGMVIVNIGIRKGEARYVKYIGKIGSYSEKGVLPEEKRVSIGTQRVPSGSVNALAFQFAMMMALVWLGKSIFAVLGANVWSGFGSMPNMLWGILGAVIVWPILCKLHKEDLVDKKTCSQISGFCLDILIVGSIATLNLTVFSSYLAPILIQFVVIVLFTIMICFWYNKKIAAHEWFEKSVFVFGQATGATPTGLALLRAVDPDSICTAPEAHGVVAAVNNLGFFWLPVLLPTLAATMPIGEISVGLIGFAVFFIVGWILFAGKNR